LLEKLFEKLNAIFGSPYTYIEPHRTCICSEWFTSSTVSCQGLFYYLSINVSNISSALASSGWTGDISLDDIDFYDGECRGSFMCDFENGMCTFSQSISDTFDWTRSNGRTGSLGTGPQNDHTFGTTEGK